MVQQPFYGPPYRDYLGDGVYVDIDRGMVRLTTENGVEVTNTIYLEPEVMAALIAYYARLKQLEAEA